MVKNEEFDMWDSKLIEGKTYIMHNFKIVKKMMGNIECVIILSSYCLLERLLWNLNLFSKFKWIFFSFQSITEIVAGNFCPDLLIGMSNIFIMFIVDDLL